MMMCPATQIHFASFSELSRPVTQNQPLRLLMSRSIHASHSQTLKMAADCLVTSGPRFQILLQTCNIGTNPCECERVSALPATESLLAQF